MMQLSFRRSHIEECGGHSKNRCTLSSMNGIADLMSWHSKSAGRAVGTRAWVQAYIPGSGWIDFDPSTGLVGNNVPYYEEAPESAWTSAP